MTFCAPQLAACLGHNAWVARVAAGEALGHVAEHFRQPGVDDLRVWPPSVCVSLSLSFSPPLSASYIIVRLPNERSALGSLFKAKGLSIIPSTLRFKAFCARKAAAGLAQERGHDEGEAGTVAGESEGEATFSFDTFDLQQVDPSPLLPSPSLRSVHT
jgi:hypothetical protein